MPAYPLISEELNEFVSLLNSHRIKIIVVGCRAVAFHGVP